MGFKKIRIKNKDEKAILEEKPDNRNQELTFDNIKSILQVNFDVIFREIYINECKDLPAGLVYIDELVNKDQISDYILKPLMQEEAFRQADNIEEVIIHIEEGRLYFASQVKHTDINNAINDLLSGNTLLVFSGQHIAFSFDTKGFEKRGIEEPSGENVIKGAKDAFIEVLRVNAATCRRKIKSQHLVIEETVVGKQTQTSVGIVYMGNIANMNIVNEVKKRLDSIEVDRAITVGYIEEFIVDDVNFLFPQVLYTERPDRFCTNIVDGRVGIIIDGSPITYIIPGTLLQFLQAPEDYSQQYIVSSLIRLLRFLSMIGTLVLPAFYVSITTFHHEMIPTELALSIAATKEGVPFPMIFEVMLMLVAFEVLVEAGLRLPKTIGQAVSIVGALVVGQSAVEAKLISPATVIVIAITAIASFTMPNQDFSNALRVWRFVLVIFSGIIGIYGLSSGLLILVYQLCRIESFGVPYLDPVVGSEEKQLQDTLLRLPLYMHKKRPLSLKTINSKRMK